MAPPVEDEVQRIRDRIHKLNDITQAHEGALALLRREVDELNENVSTSEQLDAAVKIVTMRIDHLAEGVGQVKTAMNWAVGLILGAVVLAVLGLVLRAPTTP